jgi:hypothetical protein
MGGKEIDLARQDQPESPVGRSNSFGFWTLRSGRESLGGWRARMIRHIFRHSTLDELMLPGIRLKAPQGSSGKDDFPRASVAILASQLSHDLFRSAHHRQRRPRHVEGYQLGAISRLG